MRRQRRYTPEQKAEALRRYWLGRENTCPRICQELNLTPSVLKWWAERDREKKAS